MEGIRFLTDERGRKTAVIIDLTKYGALWEDFFDAWLASQREEEPRETLDSLRQRLQREGKLSREREEEI